MDSESRINGPRASFIHTSFGNITPFQASALIILYNNRGEAYRQTLKEDIPLREANFSKSVVMPLIYRGFMQRGYVESDGRVKYFILPEGSKLAEEIIEETGY